MHGGSPLRSAPGADRSGHGDAEPAGSSHQPSRVFNVYICSARLPPCACSLACYSSNGIFQPQSTSRPPKRLPIPPRPHARHNPESPALPMPPRFTEVARRTPTAPCVSEISKTEIALSRNFATRKGCSRQDQKTSKVLQPSSGRYRFPASCGLHFGTS